MRAALRAPKAHRRFAFVGLAVLAFLCGVCLATPGATAAQAEVTREGVLREVVADDFAHDRATTSYSLESPNGRVTSVLPTTLAAEPNDEVTVSGGMHDGKLVGAVNAESSSPTEVALDWSGQPILRQRKVAVILIRFPGDPIEPWDPELARENVFTGEISANAFYQEESYGQLSLVGKENEEGDVFGWYTVDAPTDSCRTPEWQLAGVQAAEAHGVSLEGYDHIMIVTSWRDDCPHRALAALAGKMSWYNDLTTSFVFAHELGHNLGFHHASSWKCTDSQDFVVRSEACIAAEYGDPFELMGTGYRRNSDQRLAMLGILAPENIKTVTKSGTYTISASLFPTESPMALRIPQSLDPEGRILSWYYLEIRQRGGVYFEDLDDATMTGVSIRIGANVSPNQSRTAFQRHTFLLDATPGSAGASEDAPFPVGTTFDGGTARVTTLAAGGGSATVSVEMTGVDLGPPTAPGSAVATQTASGVELGWQPSSDDIGIYRYLVAREGGVIGTTGSTSFIDSSAAPGPHTYVIYAQDAAGYLSGPSPKTLVTVVADESAPTAPENLTAVLGSDSVTLSWDPSGDNFGVSRYLILRDGAIINTTPATSFIDVGVAPGQHTYVVAAEDGAGNRGPDSRPAVVSVVAPPTASHPGSLNAPIGSGPASPVSRRSVPAEPILRWRRMPNGGLRLEADASRDREVTRVAIWLDGRRLGARRGGFIRLAWKPRGRDCLHAHRFSARAYDAKGRQATAVTHVRLACTGRQGAGD